MKKLTAVISLVTLVAISAVFAACSSAEKKADEVATTQAAPAQAPASPVNLGASSSGRAR